MTHLISASAAYVLFGIACAIRIYPNGWNSINMRELEEVVNVDEDGDGALRLFATMLIAVTVLVWPLFVIRWLLVGD